VSRVGLFGGSFDPIHNGHVAAARAASHQLGLDRVWFLPTAQPPHKPGRRFAPAMRRFAMVELALLGEPGLLVGDQEMADRPSYTVETLEHFLADRPGDDLHLLLGSDSLAGLTTWRRWRELPVLARLAVFARPGWDADSLPGGLPPELRAARDGGRLVRVDNEPLAFSSTDVREALARGMQPPIGSMDPLVLDYARKYRLYDETTSPL
jgi:nicotinate-nucleotide adenylyltransferase